MSALPGAGFAGASCVDVECQPGNRLSGGLAFPQASCWAVGCVFASETQERLVKTACFHGCREPGILGFWVSFPFFFISLLLSPEQL